MTNNKTKPELLAPAGNWTALYSAIEAGCDAVYFGLKSINMRHFAGNFDLLELEKVMAYLHEHGKKGYIALNVIVYDSELEKLEKIMKTAKAANVDGIIAWDMAVLAMAKRFGLELHLSTQASVSNYEALKFYASTGITRVVLARECSLWDIEQIKKRIEEDKLNCELEVFIHGAMCVSVSGRCFLSELTFDKSANRGACVQPCRRKYKITDIDNEAEYLLGEDYILSPKDLCTIDFIDSIIESGADVFKIEGRMRSPEYAKVVTESYRRAIDAYFEGTLTDDLKADLKADMAKVYNRGFSEGFYRGEPENWITRKLEHTYEKKMIGTVSRFFNKISVAEVKVNSYGINSGDKLLFMGKNTAAEWVDDYQIHLEGKLVDKVDKGNVVGIKVPFKVKPKDKVFVWRKKDD